MTLETLPSLNLLWISTEPLNGPYRDEFKPYLLKSKGPLLSPFFQPFFMAGHSKHSLENTAASPCFCICYYLANRSLSHLSFFHLDNSYSFPEVQLRHPALYNGFPESEPSRWRAAKTYPVKALDTWTCPTPPFSLPLTYTTHLCAPQRQGPCIPHLCTLRV